MIDGRFSTDLTEAELEQMDDLEFAVAFLKEIRGNFFSDPRLPLRKKLQKVEAVLKEMKKTENVIKTEHLIPVVTTYSFDRETTVRLFVSDKEAEGYLRKTYEEELRIDREENGYDTEGMIEDDGSYAKIINHFPDRDDITEFRIGTMYGNDAVKNSGGEDNSGTSCGNGQHEASEKGHILQYIISGNARVKAENFPFNLYDRLQESGVLLKTPETGDKNAVTIKPRLITGTDSRLNCLAVMESYPSDTDGYSMMSGFAYMDGEWKYHTWLYNARTNTIIETFYSYDPEVYFGVILSDEEIAQLKKEMHFSGEYEGMSLPDIYEEAVNVIDRLLERVRPHLETDDKAVTDDDLLVADAESIKEKLLDLF